MKTNSARGVLSNEHHAPPVNQKLRRAAREAQQLFGMAHSWFDRLEMTRFLAELYLARAIPVDTYAWDACVRVSGTRYTVGLRTSEIYVLEEVMNYGLYDRLEDYVPQKDWVVFDIGANVGIVSVAHAKRGAEVYGFEPNPDCFRRFLKNVVHNGLHTRIHPFNMALGAKVGRGAMHVVKGGTTGGTVIETTAGASSSVGVTTLDEMVSATGVSRIDLLKIDVEGAEVGVLEGARRALGITRRVVLEYHSTELLRQASDILTRDGFVVEHKVLYCAEIRPDGEPEIGILYARRPSTTTNARAGVP